MIGRRIFAGVRTLKGIFATGRERPAPFTRTIDGVEYVGWVDGARNGRLVGWVASASPGDRLTVVVESAGKSLDVRADRYRADVQRRGYDASGYCGFSFPLAPLRPGPVRVFVSKPRFELGGSPAALETVAPPAPVERAVNGRWLIAIDPDPGRLSGWAWDRHAPARRPLLQLEYQGAPIESCRATLYRPDAALAGGWRGFSFGAPRKPGVYVIRDTETASEVYRHLSRASG